MVETTLSIAARICIGEEAGMARFGLTMTGLAATVSGGNDAATVRLGLRCATNASDLCVTINGNMNGFE